MFTSLLNIPNTNLKTVPCAYSEVFVRYLITFKDLKQLCFSNIENFEIQEGENPCL